MSEIMRYEPNKTIPFGQIRINTMIKMGRIIDYKHYTKY